MPRGQCFLLFHMKPTTKEIQQISTKTSANFGSGIKNITPNCALYVNRYSYTYIPVAFYVPLGTMKLEKGSMQNKSFFREHEEKYYLPLFRTAPTALSSQPPLFTVEIRVQLPVSVPPLDPCLYRRKQVRVPTGFCKITNYVAVVV